MSDENIQVTTELQRVSLELGEAKALLREEKNKRERELYNRLDALDRGQVEMLKQFDEFKEKKVNILDFDDLKEKVEAHSRLIFIGLGIATAVSIGLPIFLHSFWK